MHDFFRGIDCILGVVYLYCAEDEWVRAFCSREKYKIYTTMSKICQITGKKAMGGCNVSHSKRHTKRTFDVNLFRRKFYWVEQDVWIELNVSAAGLRTINKIGLDNALKQAAEKGYLY